MNFRDLKTNEIECRVKQITQKGVVLLLYKNARCDMNILDETVGATNWQRKHYECKGNLFCEIGIYDKEKKEWVYKGDCGTESNSDKEKGEASDSFKRAGFNWGIGRELYTAPFLFAKAADCNIKNGKCKDKFEVTNIQIENKVITGITVLNRTTGKIIYNSLNKSNSNSKTQRNYSNEITTYANLLAKNSDKTADEWRKAAADKYRTEQGQADCLIKWWGKQKDKA